MWNVRLFHSFNMGVGWSPADGLLKRPKLRFWTAGHNFDASVGKIGHPSREIQRACNARRKPAKTYSLHPPAD